MDKEQKNIVLPFEFKAVGQPDANGYVEFEGYAAAFNNVDLGKDVIVKGAFADTIKENVNWPILLDHMAYMTETAGYNLAATEDEKGLRIRGQLNTKLEAGKIVYELSKQALALGKEIGLSIGYGVQEKEFDPDTMVRTLKKLRMYEFSFTNFPMNPKASITAMKSRQLEEIKAVVHGVLVENGLIEGGKKDDSSEAAELEQRKELLTMIENLTKEVKTNV